MKFELKRQIKILSAHAILELSTQQNSGDSMVKLLGLIEKHGFNTQKLIEELNLKGEFATNAIEGLRNYLIQKKLLTLNGTLTAEAKNSITNKVYLEPEYGQYKIYYTNDEVFNQIPVKFERLDNECNISQNLDLSLDMSFDLKTKKPFRVNKVYVAGNINTIEKNEEIIITCNEDEHQTVVAIENVNQLIAKVNTKSIIDSVINEIQNNLPQYSWNRQKSRFEIENLEGFELNELKKFKASTFIKPLKLNMLGYFDTAFIRDIAIYPSEKTFVEWYLKLISDKIEKQFYSVETMKYIQREMALTTEFEDYQNQLKQIDSTSVVQYLKDSNELDKFWYLQTPMDLKFDVREGASDVITLSNQQKSMFELVKMLVGRKSPKKLVFFSKYLNQFTQQMKFKLFADAFKHVGVETVTLVKAPTTEIKHDDWFGDIKIVNNEQWTHDRYFTFFSGSKWHTYKMTGEIDQIWYPNSPENADINTIGSITDLTFIPLEIEQMPIMLQKFIKNEDANEED